MGGKAAPSAMGRPVLNRRAVGAQLLCLQALSPTARRRRRIIFTPPPFMAGDNNLYSLRLLGDYGDKRTS